MNLTNYRIYHKLIHFKEIYPENFTLFEIIGRNTWHFSGNYFLISIYDLLIESFEV